MTSINKPEVIDLLGGNDLTIFCRYLETNELLPVVLYLIEQKNVDMNIRDKKGRNALLAFFDNKGFINKFPDITKLVFITLVAHGSKVCLVDHGDKDALCKLFNASSDTKTIYSLYKLLMHHSLDLNFKDSDFGTNGATYFIKKRWNLSFLEAINPIREACYLHKLIEAFLFYGFDLSQSKNFLSCLLHDRTKHQRIFIETVKMLIKFGADINHNDEEGSPLINCCRFRHSVNSNIANLIQFLIENGANVKLTDLRTGKNALANYIISINSLGEEELRVISLLCERGTNVNQVFRLHQDDHYGTDVLRLTCKYIGKFSPTNVLSIAMILVHYGAIIGRRMLPGFRDVLLDLFSGYRTNGNVSSTWPSTSDAYRLRVQFGGYQDTEIVADEEIKLQVKASLNAWLSDDADLVDFCEDLQQELYEHDNYVTEFGQNGEIDYIASYYESSTVKVTNETRGNGEITGELNTITGSLMTPANNNRTDNRMDLDVDERTDLPSPKEKGFYLLLKFFLENGANINSCDPETSWSVVLMFLRIYRGDDFIDILQLFCQYAGVDVNSKALQENEKLNAFDSLMRNEHQRERQYEATMLLINQGLDSSSLGSKHREKLMNWLSNNTRHTNVIHLVSNKTFIS